MRPPALADVPPGPPLRSTASTSAPVCRAATTAHAPATPSPTTATSTVCSKRTSRASSAGTESIAPCLWGAADERQQLGLDVCVVRDVDARPVLTALAQHLVHRQHAFEHRRA